MAKYQGRYLKGVTVYSGLPKLGTVSVPGIDLCIFQDQGKTHQALLYTCIEHLHWSLYPVLAPEIPNVDKSIGCWLI